MISFLSGSVTWPIYNGESEMIKVVNDQVLFSLQDGGRTRVLKWNVEARQEKNTVEQCDVVTKVRLNGKGG